MVDATWLEPVTPSMSRKYSSQLSYASKFMLIKVPKLLKQFRNHFYFVKVEARSGIEPLHRSFADSPLSLLGTAPVKFHRNFTLHKRINERL